MRDINLLNTEQAKTQFKLVFQETLDETGNQVAQYFTSDDFLIIYRMNKGINHNTENQSEIPLAALSWVKDVILNGFWRSPSAGGLPKDQHSVAATFAGEEILVGRSMNAGDYGRSGFKIVNKNRKSHIMSSRPQEFQITDERVEKVLLPLFDKLGVN